jgi:hypothetical protein
MLAGADAEMAGQTSLRQVHAETERKEQEKKIGGWVSEVLEHMSLVLLVFFSFFFFFFLKYSICVGILHVHPSMHMEYVSIRQHTSAYAEYCMHPSLEYCTGIFPLFFCPR